MKSNGKKRASAIGRINVKPFYRGNGKFGLKIMHETGLLGRVYLLGDEPISERWLDNLACRINARPETIDKTLHGIRVYADFTDKQLMWVEEALIPKNKGAISELYDEADFLTESKPPSVKGIERFADWFGLSTRKSIKALAGDYDAEIRRLWGEGRTRAARWNKCLAWRYAVWYVLRSPFDAIMRYVIKGFRGGG